MSNNVELVILAAGMSSRFGGLKQIEPLDEMNHTMMDYSIFDAFRSHYSAVTFIIREECREIIENHIGKRISKYIEVKYVYQKLSSIPEGFSVPEGREKPWGTGQALLACKGIVNNPFVILNCDDFYNRNIFEVLFDFLTNVDVNKSNWAMVGYDIMSTLSKNGTVNRGICKANNGLLKSVDETYEIFDSNGQLTGRIGSKQVELSNLDKDSKVSMNVWGFTPTVFNIFENKFIDFLSNVKSNTEEFGIPNIVNDLLKENKVSVHMLKASNLWFGMTYQSDMDEVKNNICKLIESGKYPKKLLD